MTREARFEDIPAILDMGERFHAMSAWSDRPFCRDTTGKFLTRLIENENAVLLFNDHGMLGGMLAPVYFGGGTAAHEFFWFADKDGKSLLTAFEEWAKRKGADLVVMVSLALGERCDRILNNIYERRGYSLRERHYAKELR